MNPAALFSFLNPRANKEAREVLPLCLGTVSALVILSAIWPLEAESLAPGVFGLGCALMAATVFGAEFHRRTMPLLLSHPVRRAVLWREKMLVLAAGLGINFAVVCVLVAKVSGRPQDLQPPAAFALIAAVAFCTTPYWTLATRNGLIGVVASASLPALLLAGDALVCWWWFGDAPCAEWSYVPLLLVYCVLTYWRGYARFRDLQVLDEATRELNLPHWVEVLVIRRLSGLTGRLTGAFANLVKKELRLQQTSFLTTGVFVIVAAAALCLHGIYSELAVAIFVGDSAVFILLLPLLAGALSLGEERAWNVADWQLTLPPSAGRQWLAKMLTTFGTSLMLGVLLPTLGFLLGDELFGNSSGHPFSPWFILQGLVLGQCFLTALAVFGGSCSNSTLRAILLAFGLLPVFGLVIYLGWLAGDDWYRHQHYLTGALFSDTFPAMTAWLEAGAEFLVLTCLSLVFAFTNYRQRGVPVSRLLVQLLVLLFLAGGLTAVFVAFR